MKSPAKAEAALGIMDSIRSMNTILKLTLAVAVAFGVAFLDYVTGNEISFSIFYILPVFGTSWFVGRRAGIALAVLCSLLWLLADLATGSQFSHPLIPGWNALVRLVFFLVIGVSVPILRLELEYSNRALNRLAELLPLCAWCRKIRDDRGSWSSLEDYIETHTGSEVTHGICPSCIDKYFPRQGKDQLDPPLHAPADHISAA